jgi:type III restriction enzyme
MKSALLNNRGRPSLIGPGKLENVTLNPFRAGRRMQELVFDLAKVLTRDCLSQGRCDIPVHALFPQLVHVVQQYIVERVIAHKPAEKIDLFLAPYYGWLVERLVEAIRPDTSQGETPEIPRYETHRGPGTTSDVDFWTSREVREVIRSHVNFVVADTQKWEQSAAYYIDNHEDVDAFVKNAGLGFAIPYLHNGQTHDYIPDFIIRLKSEPKQQLILEIKGHDPLEEVKRAAAARWIAAVNADRSYGLWKYALVKKVSDIESVISQALK